MGVVPQIPGVRAPPNIEAGHGSDIAELLGRGRYKFPGSQPVSFARKHLRHNLLQEDYFVCEKSDGVRCLMYLTEENSQEAVYLITRRDEFYFISNLHFPTAKSVDQHHRGTLIDGELVISTLPDKSTELKYLMFDCLATHGQRLINKPLTSRLGHLKQDVYKPFSRLWSENGQFRASAEFKVELKEMQLSYAIPTVFGEILPKLGHVSDGLIFTPSTAGYVIGTDPKLLKWKPPEENTVDFVWELEFNTFVDGDTNETYLDYDSKPKFLLKVWQGKDIYSRYGEMYVTDEEWSQLKALGEPLNDRVVESYKDDDGRWRYHRFRDDKENANHTDVVQSVMESIDDHVTQKELTSCWEEIRARWKARQLEAQEQQHREKRPRYD